MIRNEYVFEDTNFIYDTNWAGEYREDDRYPVRDGRRSGNIVIPSKELAMEMLEDGFSVRETTPNPEFDSDSQPEYFIKVNMGFVKDGYRSDPHKIGVLGPDGYVTLLNADTVGMLDRKFKAGGSIRIKPNSVCCVLRPYTKGERPSLWVNELYVEQDAEMDHFGDRFRTRPVDRLDNAMYNLDQCY